MAVPNLWRTKRQRYSLEAEMCPTCTKAIFPTREICPHCHQPMQWQGAAPGSQVAGFPLLLNLPQSLGATAAGDD